MRDSKPTREALIRKGETRRWQPPAYKDFDMQGKELTFTIRLMREEERRYWSGYVMGLLAEIRGEESTETKRRDTYQKASEELFANFIEKIENVPGWAVGRDDEEGLVITEPDEIVEVIRSLPGKDGQELDNAVWDYNLLKEGEVKNSGRSSESQPGGQDTTAKSAKA